MLIQATSWSDATQRPILLYSREEGLGWWWNSVCILYILYILYVCVCYWPHVSKHWHTQTSTTIALPEQSRHSTPTSSVYLAPPPTHTHTSPIHPSPHPYPSFLAWVQMWGSKRCSPLPLALSLIKNSYSWQMQRSAMKMAVRWPLWEGEKHG